MKTFKILSLVLLVSTTLHAQYIGWSEIDTTKVAPWQTEFASRLCWQLSFWRK